MIYKRWAVVEQGLPNTIRSFDATISHMPTKDILALLASMPHLEILHL